jgi:hypothetical protein
MLPQNRLDDLPLHSNPSAVNDPDFAEAALDGLVKVFLDNNLNLTRLKRVQIE